MHQHGEPFLSGAVEVPPRTATAGAFGRLFPHLRPWQPLGRTESEQQADLRRRASSLLAPSDRDIARPENRQIAAGYTYLGQFIAHDISFDPSSIHQRSLDPGRRESFRSPRLDLDLVYGGGPEQQPYLFRQPQGSHFLVARRARRAPRSGEGQPFEELDLPRNEEGQAIVADPRSDSHLLLAQIHLACLRFHNARLDETSRTQEVRGPEAFDDAWRFARWHYQWIVLHDYLATLIGRKAVGAALQRAEEHKSLYQPEGPPFVPVEFSAGAFRFGHAMVQGTYALNDAQTGFPLLPSGPRGRPVRSRPREPRTTVCWDRFFPVHGSRKTQFSRPLRPRLSPELRRFVGQTADEASLAERDYQRGWQIGVPSGQDVARALGITPVPPSKRSDPLWYYVLREAAEREQGRHLGPVGARIISDVLVGLVRMDPESYLRVEPGWVPTCQRKGKAFCFVDFLRYAGMPLRDADLPWNQQSAQKGAGPGVE